MVDTKAFGGCFRDPQSSTTFAWNNRCNIRRQPCKSSKTRSPTPEEHASARMARDDRALSIQRIDAVTNSTPASGSFLTVTPTASPAVSIGGSDIEFVARLRLPALQPSCNTPHLQLLRLFRFLCVTLPFHKHTEFSWILSKILILQATLAPSFTLTTWANTFPGLGWRSNGSLILVKTNFRDPQSLNRRAWDVQVPKFRMFLSIQRNTASGKLADLGILTAVSNIRFGHFSSWFLWVCRGLLLFVLPL